MSNDTLPKPANESYDIRIARDGSWWHERSRIERPGLVRLFASVLRRDGDGDYWLITPAERGRITVEDAPFIAVEMVVEGSGTAQVLRLRTNLDEWVAVGAGHELRFAEGGEPYVMVRDGLEAKVARAVYYDLLELVTEVDGRQGVWSGGVFFELTA
jgi:hypothetical protein